MIRGIGQDFDAALEYLDSVYGDTCFIADAFVHDVNSFKALRNGEDARFCDLVHLIRRSYNTLKEVKRRQDMDNSQMLALIERKMGSDDRKVWFRHLEQEKKPASLSLLINWMTGEMKSRMRATAPVRSETADKGKVHHLSIKGDAQTQQRPFYRCWLCESSDHWTDQCKKFIAMAQPNRLKLAMENHVCFSCLKKAGRDHRMTTCKKKKQCSESRGGVECRYYHHPLLHDEARDNAVGSNIAFIEGQDALLPVVKAEFIGSQQRNREGNILLDTGSQISIIRQSVADELKLTGRNISVSITKVGGEQEEVKTKVNKVPIRFMDSQQRYTVSAIGLPCISDEVTEASLTDEAKQLGLDVRELHRGGGPVDLLVGIDHPKMHIGETRQGVSCAARKSPLGWVVFGAANTPTRLTHRVLHVQAAVTELSEFWSTEAMGVEAPGCQCNPTKMTKVETEEYEVINKSCKKVGSQWMVSYPWKRDPNELPDNKSQAERMLFHTEKNWQKTKTTQMHISSKWKRCWT
ncbi:hypothetical protein BSL78_07699 [Apostichopus japonicus]|uniref:Peptidase A2 domain-containing protein n=1 Tax=Stichopus japonicus TaxID=307972 RepID=A0A2G8L545_STIJA|nr:hypothetical protein BSL78_07699 [Apostichopus japonicus]